jgi:CheY-like chemotaxis protein
VKKLLIAEDDLLSAAILQELATDMGLTTAVATDGLEALRLAGQQSFDMILMDIHMPHFSGLDAIRSLRKNGVSTPIIALSASTMLNERNEALLAGANEFLTKPIKKQEFQRVVGDGAHSQARSEDT